MSLLHIISNQKATYMNYILTKTNLIASILGLFGWMNQADAQICAGNNSLNCTGDYLSGITFKNSGGTSYSVSGMNCVNTGPSNKLMTNGAVMDIAPGEVISMTIENTCIFSEYVGVWIDWMVVMIFLQQNVFVQVPMDLVLFR